MKQSDPKRGTELLKYQKRHCLWPHEVEPDDPDDGGPATICLARHGDMADIAHER
jgi:hypothetical protein